MNEQEILEAFSKIRVHKHKGKPSPHKAILILYALEQLEAGKDWVAFADAEEELKKRLQKYGHGTKPRPEYPFVRLANDEVWELKADEEIDSTRDYSPSGLKRINAKGRIKPEYSVHILMNEGLKTKINELFVDQDLRER